MPTSSPSVASTIDAKASGSARSMATARASTPTSARITAATSSSTPWRRATSTTLSPRSATARAKTAPTPSDAPATSAHGPYRTANSELAKGGDDLRQVDGRADAGRGVAHDGNGVDGAVRGEARRYLRPPLGRHRKADADVERRIALDKDA